MIFFGGGGIDKQLAFVAGASRLIEKLEFMYDLSGILVGKENMFYDNVHTTEAGNRVIAEEVTNIVMKRLK